MATSKQKTEKAIRSYDEFLRRYLPKDWEKRKTALERRDRAIERILRRVDIKG